MPFRQFLLKIHSRCNLACDYCYVYEAADQSWRRQPRSMDLDTVRRTADRIAEHARRRALPDVHVILHGGEPLLVGVRNLAAILDVLSERLSGTVPLRLAMQTNGALLDAETLDVLLRHRVRVGVSVDGGQRAHDRHRRDAGGRGSYDGAARALRLLADHRYRELYSGLLCTVDLANDPLETYRELLRFSPPRIDLLLPHGTWDQPPPGLTHRTRPPVVPPEPGRELGPAPYGNWLRTVFDRWYGAPRKETGIRLFEDLMAGLLGGTARSEAVGLAPVDLVVVETDGTIEQSDSLKVTYEGAPATGLDVFRHSFDDALRLEAFRVRQRGTAGLAPSCRRCRMMKVCGGGLYAHRYRSGTDFTNPSVYCADLADLIMYMRRRIESDIAGAGFRTREAAAAPERPEAS